MTETKKTGKVFLVGAGPGDPLLITLKAVECIKKADVLVYDYLVNKVFLSYAKPCAEKIYVGKKASAHTLSQEGINQLIAGKAKEGKIVTRLKGGDPFIFGRGGEEGEILASDNIPFEVVPGITSAISAPAYAGIPLTHRDFTSTVAFITGHERAEKNKTSINWEKISTGVGTLVFLMGVKNLPEIVKNLTNNGKDSKTPVALVRWGTWSKQESLVGTLEDIVEKVSSQNFKAPAIIIVGGVVSLREKLNWFEKRPIFGKKIVVTRAREQASGFVSQLAGLGAQVLEFPTIKIVPPDSYQGLDAAIKEIESYDWVIFTSPNGVGCFLERLKACGKDIRDLKGVKICSIGPETAKRISNLGVSVDFVPSEYRAEGIIEGIGEVSGKRILIPRAKEAREILPDTLREKGAFVNIATAYGTIKGDNDIDIKSALENNEIDIITFTSSSTVKNFVSMVKERDCFSLLDGVKIASIGPITANTVKEEGLNTDIMPTEYTISALTDAIIEHFAKGDVQ